MGTFETGPKMAALPLGATISTCWNSSENSQAPDACAATLTQTCIASGRASWLGLAHKSKGWSDFPMNKPEGNVFAPETLVDPFDYYRAIHDGRGSRSN